MPAFPGTRLLRRFIVVLLLVLLCHFVSAASSSTNATIAPSAFHPQVTLARRSPFSFSSLWTDVKCRAVRAGTTVRYLSKKLLGIGKLPPKSPSEVADRYLQLVSNNTASALLNAPVPQLAEQTNLRKFLTMEMVQRFAFYTAMVFCPSRNISQQVASARLGDDRTITVPVNGYQIVHWFEKHDLAHYVAVNPSQRLIVVVFRGSVYPRNYLDGGNAVRRRPSSSVFQAAGTKVTDKESAYSKDKDEEEDAAPPTPDGARTFAGIENATRKQLKSAVKALLEARRAYPDYGIYVASHSLGAAVGQMFTLHMRLNYRRELSIIAFYAFGKPLIGNALFEDWSAEAMAPTHFIRIVSSNDVVPNLWYDNRPDRPTEQRIRHAAHAYELYLPDPERPEMIICDGPEDERCSARQDCTKLSWENHSRFAGLPPLSSLCRLNAFGA